MSHRKTCTHQTGPTGQGGLADLPGQVVSQAMAQAPLGASGWNGRRGSTQHRLSFYQG